MTENAERNGSGRRVRDTECDRHREELEEVKTDSAMTKGRFTAMLWFLGIVGTILSIGMVTLITKTSDIQTLLSKNDVTLMQHTERIDSLRKEVDEIKSRNRYIDSKVEVNRGGSVQYNNLR